MTSFIAADGSGRSTSVIPAVPAASSVTTIAFILDLPCLGSTPAPSTRDGWPATSVAHVRPTTNPAGRLPGSAADVRPRLHLLGGRQRPARHGAESLIDVEVARVDVARTRQFSKRVGKHLIAPG